MHALDLVPDLRNQFPSQQQLQVHLQTGQRRAQLVGGIGKETLLNRAGLAHPAKQLVERLDGRRNLERSTRFGERA